MLPFQDPFQSTEMDREQGSEVIQSCAIELGVFQVRGDKNSPSALIMTSLEMTVSQKRKQTDVSLFDFIISPCAEQRSSHHIKMQSQLVGWHSRQNVSGVKKSE